MKILHLIPALKFFRVYQSFKEYPGLEQMIIGPTEVAEPRFHYGYADFGIKNVRTFINRNHKQKNKLKECQEIQKYIDDFCPDVVTQTRLKNKGIVLPPQAKRVFVNHGMVGDDIARFLLGEEPPNKHAYSEFDLCCGATEIYRNYLTNDFSVDPGKIVLNALPQLDLLSNPDYYNSKKSLFVPSVLAKKPIILYFGHIGIEETIGIRPHRREFFDTLFELAEVVNKIDGILFVKPRANYVDLREMSAAEKLLKTHYKPIWKNPRVKFINTQYPIYQYMFADIVVCNGYSTTEVEAVIAGKPVVKVNLITKPLIKDYYKTLEEGAAIEVTAIKDILPAINTILKSGQMRNTLEEGRNRFISKHNILLDGKANERILDRIIKLSDTTQDVPPQVYVKKTKYK